MKWVPLIALAVCLPACASYEVGETYEFAGKIKTVDDVVNSTEKKRTRLMTDKGEIEFYGHCENAAINDDVTVQLVRDAFVFNYTEKFWFLEKCTSMNVSI